MSKTRLAELLGVEPHENFEFRNKIYHIVESTNCAGSNVGIVCEGEYKSDSQPVHIATGGRICLMIAHEDEIIVKPYLKPCPFCGSNDIEIVDSYPHYAFCVNCNAQLRSPPFAFGNDGVRQAAERWNRRI